MKSMDLKGKLKPYKSSRIKHVVHVCFPLFLQSFRYGAVLCCVFCNPDLDDADDGDHFFIEGKVLSGLYFHQVGKCGFFFFGIFKDLRGSHAENGRVGKTILAGDFPFKGLQIAFHLETDGGICTDHIQLVTGCGAVYI